MRAIGKAAVMLAGAAVGLAAGCLISPDDLAARECVNDGNCPSGYLCQPGEDGARRCLLQYPLPQDGGPADSGPPGPPVYYCTDIKPLLDYYCVTCHGPTNQQGGNFRLDSYSAIGSTPGAYSFAGEIKYRVALARTMPPPDAGAFPSDQERQRFAEWVDAGAPECTPPDAGPDAGGCNVVPPDGGYYATQIQPIFDANCSACHFGSGALGYCKLVGVPSTCNPNLLRVAPRDAGGSLLYLQLTNGAGNCTSYEPRNSPQPLGSSNPAATTKIRDWIVNGADAN